MALKSKRINRAKGAQAMKLNFISYKNCIRKIMKEQYEVMPVVSKLEIQRNKKGQLVVVNMVEDEDTGERRFAYGLIGNSKAIRQLQPSNLVTKHRVALEEEKDNGEIVNFREVLSPTGRYRYYDSMVMVKFGKGVALDLMTNGFKVDANGVVTINDNSETDEVYVGEDKEYGTPCWGPSNEKHANSFFFNIGQRSRDSWYQFCDSLTGGAFEYHFSLTEAPQKPIKKVARWGNYLTGSINGPVIDLTKDYICVINREQSAMPDFKEIPKYLNPGTNIQDGGEVTNAELWKEFYASKGMYLSIEDICKLSPQVRFDYINSKVMDTIEDNASIEWRLQAVEKLYAKDDKGNDAVKYYGNRNGRCMLVVDTDGAKLQNIAALEEGKCKLQAVIMNYAKTNKTSTSGQLMDKYNKKDLEKAKEIITDMYEAALQSQLDGKVDAYFDPQENFANNMLALMGTDALNYKEVAVKLTEDLLKYGAKAIGRLKVAIDSMYSHAKFDNTYVKTHGKYGYTLYVKYLPGYDNFAVEAFNPDILEDKAEEIAAIYADTTLTDKERELKLDALLTCITIKYPSAGPEEYEIIRYLTREELQERIDRMKLDAKAKEEVQKYWDRSQYGVTVYAPINILKNKLAGMDIDFDATAADFSQLKEILLADKSRVVDFIDYYDQAYKED